MRHRKVSKRPFERGGGFSAAKKLEPDRVPTMDELIKGWKGHIFARDILKEAKKFGIEPDRFGKNYEEINHSIGVASKKLSMQNLGYCKTVYAVASMIIANNDLDTSKWLINEMISKVEEKEVKKHLGNVSAIMEKAKSLKMTIDELGSISRESTADEIIRVATNNKYRYARLGLSIVVIGQKAEKMDDIVLKKIIPRCEGSELYGLESYILDRKNHRRISEEKADLFIERIRNLLKSRGLPA